MHISEQIQNIMNNFNLDIKAAQTAVLSKDLSSYENYNGEELLVAVIDNYWLEVGILEQAERLPRFAVIERSSGGFVVYSESDIIQGALCTDDEIIEWTTCREQAEALTLEYCDDVLELEDY